jgi:hypothetical protein
VFWFYLQFLSKRILILRRIGRDMIKKCNGLHIKCPLFLSDFNETWIFSTDFRKNTQISNFIKILLVGAELFHADRRTGMTKLIVALRNFAKANKKHPNFETIFAAFYNHSMAIRDEWTYWYRDIPYTFIDIRSILAQHAA